MFKKDGSLLKHKLTLLKDTSLSVKIKAFKHYFVFINIKKKKKKWIITEEKVVSMLYLPIIVYTIQYSYYQH